MRCKVPHLVEGELVPCGGKIVERIVEDRLSEICDYCGREPSLSGGLILKSKSPEQLSFSGFFPEQLSLGL